MNPHTKKLIILKKHQAKKEWGLAMLQVAIHSGLAAAIHYRISSTPLPHGAGRVAAALERKKQLQENAIQTVLTVTDKMGTAAEYFDQALIDMVVRIREGHHRFH